LEQASIEKSQPPEDLDEPFIPKYYFRYETDDAEENSFRFFVTTKRLLSQADKSKHLHTDATYKVKI
jgi:hypothetical protein